MATAAPLSLHRYDAASPLTVALATIPREGVGSGLREVDELVRDGGARGFVFVQSTGSVLDALGRHVERRARALGRPLIKIDGMPTDDPWRELAARFSLPPQMDPPAAAHAIVERAGAAVVVVREGAATCFGRALASALAHLSLITEETPQPPIQPVEPARTLVLVFTEGGVASGDGLAAHLAARVIEVEAEVSAGDQQIWWEAVSRDPKSRVGAGLDRLDALEGWWAAARAMPLALCEAPVGLGPDAQRLLARIALSQRSWLASQIGRLGPTLAAQELVRTGVLALDLQGRLVAGSECWRQASLSALPAAVEASEALAVAAALDALGDPWASIRASELHASAGAFDQAEAAAGRAVRAGAGGADASARADFWRRWERTLAALPEVEALPRLLRSVDVALHYGDVERALELGSAALHRRPDSFATLLALGRANVARGDLSTASCWLGKALAATRADDEAARARVAVELAEVRHMEGDIEGARQHAAAVLASPVAPAGADAATRLHARNVLGKILLAARAFGEAEAHFAADACEAALAGDLTAELRARLNRSIALLSSGRLDDARAMLAAVLAEGEGRGEPRAVAYALTNLAAIATLKREYVEALRLSERAFEARRRLGDKVTLALLITNMAELKLQLGMVSEAEQALAFGRQACGPGMPGSRVSHFAITAALIHLERGRTVLAAAELKTALAAASRSSHGARLGECWRVAARIALENGDLAAAESALGQAAESAESPRERAWVAVLGTARARAAGEPYRDAAAEALERARVADDPELCREAHVLAHHAALLDGDARSARGHLESAATLRDQIADTLPEDMRRRFLARRDLMELGRLLAGHVQSQMPHLPHTPHLPDPQTLGPVSELRHDGGCRPQTPAPALHRMVGRTPAMLALATAVHKVGRSDATVLIHGESGTGKELVAEAIHETSARRAGPIVKVNCAALVETLLLSELFGHERGSFTGAAARRRGRFEVAEGGTLFLDEIGDISPRTQVALLRVLQDKTFERVGGVASIRADVRIVCATHRDLGALVGRGEFREDLYYRLRGVVLEVPALRRRLADLPCVAAAILDRIAAERGTALKRLSAAAIEGLGRHAWPGNVRELENALRAAALFSDDDVIELEDFTRNVDSLCGLAVGRDGPSALVTSTSTLPPPTVSPLAPETSQGPLTLSSAAQQAAGMDDGTPSASSHWAMAQTSKIAQFVSGGSPGSATELAYAAIRGGVSLSDLKRDIERDCIARALAETGGNITRAATLLGMKRPRLSQLVKQYGFGADLVSSQAPQPSGTGGSSAGCETFYDGVGGHDPHPKLRTPAEAEVAAEDGE